MNIFDYKKSFYNQMREDFNHHHTPQQFFNKDIYELYDKI